MSTSSAFVSSISQPSSSPTSSGGGGGGGQPNSFYKNLFYILIGLLCAFGLVSFLSLLRARRRRASILREAERLGVLVPGVPGYIPLRDREDAIWVQPDGKVSPDWWEVKQSPDSTAIEQAENGNPASIDPPIPQNQLISADTFTPLALIPPPTTHIPEPIPISPLPYFPNHLAYRAESLFPLPSRFADATPETLDGLQGGHVEILTIIQMPMPPWPAGREVSEEEEVGKEWGGIELGMVRMDVGGDGQGVRVG